MENLTGKQAGVACWSLSAQRNMETKIKRDPIPNWIIIYLVEWIRGDASIAESKKPTDGMQCQALRVLNVHFEGFLASLEFERRIGWDAE